MIDLMILKPGDRLQLTQKIVAEVTENMGDLQVRRLPVLNRDKRLVGIIALGDIARAHSGDGTADALSRISRPGGQHAQA